MARGRVDAGRSGDPRLVVAHRHLDAHAPQLPRGAGQPAVPLRPPAGLRVPAGGRRQPRPAPPRAVLEVPRRVAAARRIAGRLARGGHLRHRGRAVAVHAAGHAPDRRRHRHRARPHRRDRDGRRPAGRGRRSSRTSRPAITPATAGATASAPTATCRSSTCARSTAVTRMTPAPEQAPGVRAGGRAAQAGRLRPRMKRPLSTVAGVVLVLLRVASRADRARRDRRWTGASVADRGRPHRSRGSTPTPDMAQAALVVVVIVARRRAARRCAPWPCSSSPATTGRA